MFELKIDSFMFAMQVYPLNLQEGKQGALVRNGWNFSSSLSTERPILNPPGYRRVLYDAGRVTDSSAK